MQLASPANAQDRRHFTAVLAGDREWMPSLDAPDPFVRDRDWLRHWN